jgi:DNA polymerase-4
MANHNSEANASATGPRRIIHVDMDAFYASIEQRDHPEKYGGIPIAVGGSPPSGVVMTASYEARPDGVTSAMPSAEAKRKCPDLLFVPPRMDVYKREGRAIRSILREYTDLVEPVSLDEAYLDVTEPKKGPRSGTLIAQKLRERIYRETGLTASAGVSNGKFLAKLASDENKPDGLAVIPPGEARSFLRGLPIGRFHGVGPVTEDKMRRLGIETGADLQTADKELLHTHFGRRGLFFYRMAHGEDQRRVKPDRERKSIGAEKTFSPASNALSVLDARLEQVGRRLWRRSERAETTGRTVTLKLKYADFTVESRQHTLSSPVRTEDAVLALGRHLLRDPHAPTEPVRLVGLTVSNLVDETTLSGQQLWLPFADLEESGMCTTTEPGSVP